MMTNMPHLSLHHPSKSNSADHPFSDSWSQKSVQVTLPTLRKFPVGFNLLPRTPENYGTLTTISSVITQYARHEQKGREEKEAALEKCHSHYEVPSPPPS